MDNLLSVSFLIDQYVRSVPKICWVFTNIGISSYGSILFIGTGVVLYSYYLIILINTKDIFEVVNNFIT